MLLFWWILEYIVHIKDRVNWRETLLLADATLKYLSSCEFTWIQVQDLFAPYVWLVFILIKKSDASKWQFRHQNRMIFLFVRCVSHHRVHLYFFVLLRTTNTKADTCHFNYKTFVCIWISGFWLFDIRAEEIRSSKESSWRVFRLCLAAHWLPAFRFPNFFFYSSTYMLKHKHKRRMSERVIRSRHFIYVNYFPKHNVVSLCLCSRADNTR